LRHSFVFGGLCCIWRNTHIRAGLLLMAAILDRFSIVVQTIVVPVILAVMNGIIGGDDRAAWPHRAASLLPGITGR